MTTKHLDITALYTAIQDQQEQAKQRRIASGKPKINEMTADQKRAYNAAKQRENRQKQRHLKDKLGHNPMTAQNIDKALVNAIYDMIADSNQDVIPVVEQAASRMGVDRDIFKDRLLHNAMKKAKRQ